MGTEARRGRLHAIQTPGRTQITSFEHSDPEEHLRAITKLEPVRSRNPQEG